MVQTMDQTKIIMQTIVSEQVNDSKTELIEHMHLSTRTYNALKRNDINLLYDLEMISEEELCAIKGFGAGCIAEIHACMEWHNTSVGARRINDNETENEDDDTKGTTE